MKAILIILFFFPFSCFAQKDSLQKQNKIDTGSNIFVEYSLLRSINQSAFESYVYLLADSINNASDIGALPKFLTNPNFDIDNSFFWTQGDNSISLRDIIISRVNSCHSLKLIISDKTGIYKKKPSLHRDNIKFYKFSFYDFALQRFSRLACNR